MVVQQVKNDLLYAPVWIVNEYDSLEYWVEYGEGGWCKCFRIPIGNRINNLWDFAEYSQI